MPSRVAELGLEVSTSWFELARNYTVG